MWFAVTNTRCHFSGTSGNAMCPASAMRSIRSSEYQPSVFAIATKSSFTSGISTPAWLRMNATAKSGSIPELQPAMIEIVPVGATVVTLQFRSRRIGRMRSPFGPRAQVSSGPQMLRSHSGNTPRSCASRSDSTLASSSTNCLDLAGPGPRPRPSRTAMPSLTKRSARPMTPSPMRRMRWASVGDLRQRVLVDVDDVLEEVGARGGPPGADRSQSICAVLARRHRG